MIDSDLRELNATIVPFNQIVEFAPVKDLASMMKFRKIEYVNDLTSAASEARA